jgi:hypothetical protein
MLEINLQQILLYTVEKFTRGWATLLKRLMGKSKYVGIFHCHQWKIPIIEVEKIVRFP